MSSSHWSEFLVPQVPLWDIMMQQQGTVLMNGKFSVTYGWHLLRVDVRCDDSQKIHHGVLEKESRDVTWCRTSIVFFWWWWCGAGLPAHFDLKMAAAINDLTTQPADDAPVHCLANSTTTNLTLASSGLSVPFPRSRQHTHTHLSPSFKDKAQQHGSSTGAYTTPLG